MVAHLVRLKLQLMGNSLRRSAWQVIGVTLGALYAMGLLVGVLVGLGLLALQGPELRAVVLVLGGSLLVLGWWLVPLVAFGADATLDPRRVAPFPIRRQDLVLGLGLASLVGLPGIVTAVAALSTGLTWWRSPIALLVGVLGGALGLLTCVLGSRLLTTALAAVVTRRRFREVSALLLMVPLVLAGPIVEALGRGLEDSADLLQRVHAVAAWTPFGAPWALAADVEAGRWGALAGRAALSVAVVGLLTLAWDRALTRALVRPSGGGSSARTAGLGPFGWLPGTPTGAVAARALTYWVRDPRYSAGVVVVPLMPFVLWFATGGSDVMLLVGPLTAYLIGWVISADLAYDHTAFWLHVASPLRGRQDRAGRVLASLVVGLPTSLVLALVSLALTGRWDAAVPVIGVTVGVLLGSLGVASAASVLVVHPVPRPGDSPFTSPPGGSGLMMLGQMAGSLALLVLLSPAVVLGIVAVLRGGVALAASSTLLGLLLGAALLVGGVRLGGRVYDRRPARLLAKVMSQG